MILRCEVEFCDKRMLLEKRADGAPQLAGSVAEGAGKLEARVAQAESDAVSTVPVKAARRTRASAEA